MEPELLATPGHILVKPKTKAGQTQVGNSSIVTFFLTFFFVPPLS
jgi:hypothetical protein